VDAIPEDDAAPAADAAPAPDKCGTQPSASASKCTKKDPASILRGIAHFDPKAYAAGGPDAGGAAPQLSIFLNHRQYAERDEWQQGGHPHAFKFIASPDVTKGEIPFEIDMCELGTAMWTEDDCDFNLVLILDKNGNNTADPISINMVPDQGELSKMTVVQFHCGGTSACLDVTLDCANGQACVTYDSPGACKCAAKSCDSDAITCTK
jgi:hypothetical protein